MHARSLWIALAAIAILIISGTTLNYVDKHCAGHPNQQKLIKNINIGLLIIASLLLLSVLFAHGGKYSGSASVQKQAARLRNLLNRRI